jgi:hypothetical protein
MGGETIMLSLQTKAMVKNLIEQLDMEKCLQNSFKNYHTEGLYYINLFRDLDLTVKLYFMMPGLVKNRNVGYLVSPHTHAYNFTTEVIKGSVRHLILTEDAPKDPNYQWYKYKYESIKKPEDRLSYIGETNLGIESDFNYVQGQSYYVDTDTIHSLIVPEDEMTILLLHQFEDKVSETDFYTTLSEKPSFKNIYKGYTEDEVKALLNIVMEEINK